ncbi:CHAT domain-containing protein [Suillus plorans]|uniref:CHAT domain-containing protein n=1 Tax=Suillus plorans TaxID=116603 RepID=A0A9P7ADH6_9AGAM|nr:CHAT domain-containing protein [Suillus plorans]KAG1787124.1 CHAT domain-containing protein [Suillus plorans]
MEALALLTDAGHSLLARYRRTQNSGDIEQSIKHFERALNLCPMDHPYHPAALFNLATAKFVSCQADGRYLDLDILISHFQKALELRATDHPDRSATQLHLAIALLSRIEPGALDEVISLHYDALGFYNTGNASQGQLLGNLSLMLATRFQRRGNDEDLDQAIALNREVLALHPVGHTDRYMSLSNLAHRGNDEDLDEAIALQREALALCQVGHTDRSGLLNNLAHRGNDEDLDQTIALHREALALHPVGHTYRSGSLNNLALQLSSHFKHRGNDEDLDQAIALHREALALRPVGHIDRSMSLNNLALQLSSRFKHRGNDKDLDEAIALHREALALRPVSHTDRSMSLNDLALQLSSRFQHQGNDEDLDEAISLHREALTLRPVGHTDRSISLNNLALQLSSRSQHRGNDEDLDEAIALHREALALHPVGHTDRSSSLNNLAIQLSYRFQHRGNDKDLDQAIALQREALALLPVGHTDRSSSLNNLAIQLSSRFEHRGNDEDLDEAIALHREALALLPVGHTDRSGSLNNLANHLSSRFQNRGNDEDLNEACRHRLLSRLRRSLRWVRHASEHSHGTQLEAYVTSMQLLDAYMSVTASVSSRHDVMKEFPSTLAVDAASCALRSGDARRAIELLEQGRTIIWTQMARLRTPLDSLETCGDHAVTLMKKFRDLSSLLNKPPASHSEGASRVVVEAEETRYRRLVEEWNGTVEEIRKIEGFSRFLLPPLSSCDAIIIPHEQDPTSIQLPTNLEKLIELVLRFREAVDKDPDPDGKQRALMGALTELWDIVVQPVVENLGRIVRQGSRIWWCPTSIFNFLPLHAAGRYKKDGGSLSRLYISSYTPSLTALIKARASHDRSPLVPFVAIGQNHPAGALFTLDAVEPELELVRRLMPPPPTVSFSKITSVDATKSTALRALQDNTWFHLACHGTQRFDEPFQSAFLMQDQPLSLLDIAQMDMSRHQFAFLSACETAVGDFRTPDEVIHLAAGLQFAGVKSVVGTLWKVDDSTVQRFVEKFYKNLCGDGTMDSKRAAQALHRAVQSLASDRVIQVPLAQRIVFVHIGI